MKKIPFRTRLLLVALTLLLAALMGFAVGKYKNTISIKGTITFSARLAEDVLLQEHEAVRQPDGSYQLNTGKTLQGNTYKLIPGLDIPKDPHIIIKGKTPIPAYLYVEIVDTLDTAKIGQEDVKLISYAVADSWERTDLTGANGGTVYKYNTVLSNENFSDPIYILADNGITVSQYVKSYDYTANSDQDVLKFYAYLEEQTSN